jgi:enediyne biosynthesis protein E5
MKIGAHHVASMYLIVIALLVALAGIAAYSAGIFPVSLVAAVLACILMELALVRAQGKKLRLPMSAIITGLIIGSVAPITAPILLVILASAIAESTKFFIKLKSRNVFNPAAIGLLVALILFGVGDEWWASPSIHFHGLLVPLAGILIISAWQSRRLFVGLAAAAIATIGTAALSGFFEIGLLTSALAVNYYFVFLMATDPKTSPNSIPGQILYGSMVSALALILIMAHVQYSLLIALALANLSYAAFRVFYKPVLSRTQTGTAAEIVQPS